VAKLRFSRQAKTPVPVPTITRKARQTIRRRRRYHGRRRGVSDAVGGGSGGSVMLVL